MTIEGKRVKEVRWVHAARCVVRVMVDAVIPVGDPSEPCFEPDTVRFLRQVHQSAEAGDIAWLQTIGTVYVKTPTA
jgi:hypothetical protein